MTQEDAVDLGYEMNEALKLYLDSMGASFADREVYRAALVQLFWENKVGLISYLLGGPAKKESL